MNRIRKKTSSVLLIGIIFWSSSALVGYAQQLAEAPQHYESSKHEQGSIRNTESTFFQQKQLRNDLLEAYRQPQKSLSKESYTNADTIAALFDPARYPSAVETNTKNFTFFGKLLWRTEKGTSEDFSYTLTHIYSDGKINATIGSYEYTINDRYQITRIGIVGTRNGVKTNSSTLMVHDLSKPQGFDSYKLAVLMFDEKRVEEIDEKYYAKIGKRLNEKLQKYEATGQLQF